MVLALLMSFYWLFSLSKCFCLPIIMYCSKLWLTLLVYIFLHEFSYCYLKSTTCLLFSLSFPCLSIFSKNLSLFLKNYPRKIMAESSLRWNKRRAMIILFLIICRHKTVMEMYCEKRTSSCFYGYQTILYFFSQENLHNVYLGML